MNALVLAVLLCAPSRSADFDRFAPAGSAGAAVVAVSSAAASDAPAPKREAGAADFAGWGKLAETPLGIAEGGRPAWTSVVPEEKPWQGPKRLERVSATPQFVDRQDVDGIEVLKHESGLSGGGSSAASTSGSGSPAALAAAAALTAAMTGSAGARVVSHDESRPYGQRNLWEISMPDGSKRYVRASPLVLDLKGGGVRTSERTVLYDLYGTGNKQRMEWINDLAPGMGLLVFDAGKTGVSGANGLGLFGDSTDLDGDGKADGYLDGFKALRAFVAKAISERVIDGRAWRDGVLDASDLKKLQKAYGLKVRVGGLNAAPRSLASAGVRALSFTGEPVQTQRDFDRQGNDCARQKGAVFLRADGTTGVYEDVWFKPKNNVMVVGK